jgi:hypothetical protein
MGIYIAAVITAIAALALFGFLLRRASAPQDHRMLLLAGLIALPLQPLAYFFVRVPLDGLLSQVVGRGPVLTTLQLLYAPLTEEPAKWLVLLVPPVIAKFSPRNAVPLALATGLGFGLGEIFFIAHSFAKIPAVASLPFYYFSPFLIERMQVCFIHGAFIALAFKWLAEKKSFLLGGMIGMALHFALNFPIYLAQIDLFGIGAVNWGSLLTAWILAMTVGLAILVWQAGGEEFRARLMGRRPPATSR